MKRLERGGNGDFFQTALAVVDVTRLLLLLTCRSSSNRATVSGALPLSACITDGVMAGFARSACAAAVRHRDHGAVADLVAICTVNGTAHPVDNVLRHLENDLVFSDAAAGPALVADGACTPPSHSVKGTLGMFDTLTRPHRVASVHRAHPVPQNQRVARISGAARGVWSTAVEALLAIPGCNRDR